MKGLLTATNMKDRSLHNKIFLAITILSLVIFGIIMIRSDLIDFLNSKEINNDNIKKIELEDKMFLKTDLHTLSYSGIDYYEDGAKIGGYYYTTSENDVSVAGRYLFILVKDKNTPPVIEYYDKHVIVLSDADRISSVNGIIAANTGLLSNEISLMTRSFILSEIDFPFVKLLGTSLLLLALLLLGILSLFGYFRSPKK